MAEQKKSFPMLYISHWWALRKKFKQSIPGVVTDGYLATVLEMKANSARANVLPFLKTLGIIDADGKTGDRARQWRDDGHYSSVCKAILMEVYPQELLDAVGDTAQRSQAESWFANETGSGAAAVSRMAALYMVLLEGDPAKQADQEKAERAKKNERPTEKLEKNSGAQVSAPAPSYEPAIVHTAPQNPQLPSININLEIHISADSTPDQIDAIFTGMAKHIYRVG
jgi:Family of unknown function (DUF5343)